MELGLAEMTCWLVHTSYSLPEWQAVKLTFFAPWGLITFIENKRNSQLLDFLPTKFIISNVKS